MAIAYIYFKGVKYQIPKQLQKLSKKELMELIIKQAKKQPKHKKRIRKQARAQVVKYTKQNEAEQKKKEEEERKKREDKEQSEKRIQQFIADAESEIRERERRKKEFDRQIKLIEYHHNKIRQTIERDQGRRRLLQYQIKKEDLTPRQLESKKKELLEYTEKVKEQKKTFVEQVKNIQEIQTEKARLLAEIQQLEDRVQRLTTKLEQEQERARTAETISKKALEEATKHKREAAEQEQRAKQAKQAEEEQTKKAEQLTRKIKSKEQNISLYDQLVKIKAKHQDLRNKAKEADRLLRETVKRSAELIDEFNQKKAKLRTDLAKLSQIQLRDGVVKQFNEKWRKKNPKFREGKVLINTTGKTLEQLRKELEDNGYFEPFDRKLKSEYEKLVDQSHIKEKTYREAAVDYSEAEDDAREEMIRIEQQIERLKPKPQPKPKPVKPSVEPPQLQAEVDADRRPQVDKEREKEEQTKQKQAEKLDKEQAENPNRNQPPHEHIPGAAIQGREEQQQPLEEGPKKTLADYIAEDAAKIRQEQQSKPESKRTSTPEEIAAAKAKEEAQAQAQPAPEQEQTGEGRTKDIALYNDQIDKFMRGFPGYLGTIASDMIGTLKPKPQSRGSFIMNLDPKHKEGSHWVGVYFDARPNGSHSFEYYNSFGDRPTAKFMEDIKPLIQKLELDGPIKFKYNKIHKQDDNTNSCGFFAMKFILDRMRGKPFPTASGYDDSVRGEEDIDRFKQRLGIPEEFGYLNQQGEGIGDFFGKVKRTVGNIIESFKGLRTEGSPMVREFLKQNGSAHITSWQVGRAPLKSVIDTVANLLSLGKWAENKKKLGYDDMFHLFLDITLDNGKKFRFEKNQTVEINEAKGYAAEKDEQTMPINPPSLMLGEIVKAAEAIQGKEKFWIYDSITANCQFFVKSIIQGAQRWNPQIERFVMQDAEKVIEGFGWFQNIAKATTDLAHRADIAIHGRGREKFKKAVELIKRKYGYIV